MRRTRFTREIGKVLYPSTSTLPSDFYASCEHHFNIQFQFKTYIGVRSSQQRGIFLHPSERVKQNQVIATIPLTSLYRVSNIHLKPNTMQHLRVHDVENAIKSNEFKMMAPQIYLGLQFSSIASQLPDISRQKSEEDIQKSIEVLREGANPWARMLDDEDFNEDYILGMYGMSLDNWQRNSFDDLTTQFKLAMNQVYLAVQPPFKPEHFRRFTRLVIARAEHAPPEDYYDGSAWMRRMRRHWRQLRRIPDPSDLAMVPFLDMLNHSNRPNIGVRMGPTPALGGKGAVTIYSLCDIEPGEELCRHYNFAISRPFALFRYGFLPFDLITMVEHDGAGEHYFKNLHMLDDESKEDLAAQEALEAKADELEKIFKKARSSGPVDPSQKNNPK